MNCKIQDYFTTHDYRMNTTRDKIKLQICCDCEHVWSAYIPTIEEISQYYKEDFYKHSKKKSDFITLLNRKCYLYNIKKCKGKKVLDIGSGDGSLVSYLTKNGLNAFGQEPSVTGRAVAKENWDVDLIADDLFDIEDRFDIINMSHVLEHVVDPLMVLNKIHTLLKDGGCLSLEVPNRKSWEAKIFRSIYVHVDSPRHIHHFNKKSLSVLLKKANFTNKNINGMLSIVQFPLSGIHSINNYLIFNKKKTWFNNMLIKIIAIPYIPIYIFINLLSADKVSIGGVFYKQSSVKSL